MAHPAQPQLPLAAAHRNVGAWVVAGLLLASLGLGVWAQNNYVRSEHFLAQAGLAMKARGGQLGVEQCIDAVLAWTHRCEAMKSLCEASLPRMMDACLAARPRQADCAAIRSHAADARFGFAPCAARRLDRNDNKLCTVAYGAFADFCRRRERQETRP